MTDAQTRPGPVTPYLTVSDANAAIEFYKEAFGAVEVARQPGPDGKKLIHAAVSINGGTVMLSDDFPEFGDGRASTPEAFGGSPVAIHLELADVDAVWEQALAAGATVRTALEDQFWGDRFGEVADPFGHRWALSMRKRDVSDEEMREAMRSMG